MMSNKEVVDFVRQKISQQIKPAEVSFVPQCYINRTPGSNVCVTCFQICESILNHCLAPDCRLGGVGCDNMTVIIVCFLHGCGYSDLAMRCGVPVEPKPSPTHQFVEHKRISWKSTTYEASGSPIGHTSPIQPAKLESTNIIEDFYSSLRLDEECAPDPDILPESTV